MVTTAEYERVNELIWQFRRKTQPKLMTSGLHETHVKTEDGGYKCQFSISIGREPFPWDMLVTSDETLSDTPQDAYEKAMNLIAIRLTPHPADAAPASSAGEDACSTQARRLKPGR